MDNIKLGKTTWLLIFGGMLVGAFGVSLGTFTSVAGTVLVVAGAVAIALGAVLIWVRSRRPD